MNERARHRIPIILGTKPAAPLCDFCEEPNRPPVWRYEIPAYRQIHPRKPGDVLFLDGNWHACERCAALVQANDRDTILELGMAACRRKWPNREPKRKAILWAHSGFWRNRPSKRTPITAADREAW